MSSLCSQYVECTSPGHILRSDSEYTCNGVCTEAECCYTPIQSLKKNVYKLDTGTDSLFNNFTVTNDTIYPNTITPDGESQLLNRYIKINDGTSDLYARCERSQTGSSYVLKDHIGGTIDEGLTVNQVQKWDGTDYVDIPNEQINEYVHGVTNSIYHSNDGSVYGGSIFNENDYILEEKFKQDIDKFFDTVCSDLPETDCNGSPYCIYDTGTCRKYIDYCKKVNDVDTGNRPVTDCPSDTGMTQKGCYWSLAKSNVTSSSSSVVDYLDNVTVSIDDPNILQIKNILGNLQSLRIGQELTKESDFYGKAQFGCGVEYENLKKFLHPLRFIDHKAKSRNSKIYQTAVCTTTNDDGSKTDKYGLYNADLHVYNDIIGFKKYICQQEDEDGEFSIVDDPFCELITKARDNATGTTEREYYQEKVDKCEETNQKYIHGFCGVQNANGDCDTNSVSYNTHQGNFYKKGYIDKYLELFKNACFYGDSSSGGSAVTSGTCHYNLDQLIDKDTDNTTVQGICGGTYIPPEEGRCVLLDNYGNNIPYDSCVLPSENINIKSNYTEIFGSYYDSSDYDLNFDDIECKIVIDSIDRACPSSPPTSDNCENYRKTNLPSTFESVKMDVNKRNPDKGNILGPPNLCNYDGSTCSTVSMNADECAAIQNAIWIEGEKEQCTAGDIEADCTYTDSDYHYNTNDDMKPKLSYITTEIDDKYFIDQDDAYKAYFNLNYDDFCDFSTHYGSTTPTINDMCSSSLSNRNKCPRNCDNVTSPYAVSGGGGDWLNSWNNDPKPDSGLTAKIHHSIPQGVCINTSTQEERPLYDSNSCQNEYGCTSIAAEGSCITPCIWTIDGTDTGSCQNNNYWTTSAENQYLKSSPYLSSCDTIYNTESGPFKYTDSVSGNQINYITTNQPSICPVKMDTDINKNYTTATSFNPNPQNIFETSDIIYNEHIFGEITYSNAYNSAEYTKQEDYIYQDHFNRIKNSTMCSSDSESWSDIHTDNGEWISTDYDGMNTYSGKCNVIPSSTTNFLYDTYRYPQDTLHSKTNSFSNYGIFNIYTYNSLDQKNCFNPNWNDWNWLNSDELEEDKCNSSSRDHGGNPENLEICQQGDGVLDATEASFCEYRDIGNSYSTYDYSSIVDLLYSPDNELTPDLQYTHRPQYFHVSKYRYPNKTLTDCVSTLNAFDSECAEASLSVCETIVDASDTSDPPLPKCRLTTSIEPEYIVSPQNDLTNTDSTVNYFNHNCRAVYNSCLSDPDGTCNQCITDTEGFSNKNAFDTSDTCYGNVKYRKYYDCMYGLSLQKPKSSSTIKSNLGNSDIYGRVNLADEGLWTPFKDHLNEYGSYLQNNSYIDDTNTFEREQYGYQNNLNLGEIDLHNYQGLEYNDPTAIKYPNTKSIVEVGTTPIKSKHIWNIDRSIDSSILEKYEDVYNGYNTTFYGNLDNGIKLNENNYHNLINHCYSHITSFTPEPDPYCEADPMCVNEEIGEGGYFVCTPAKKLFEYGNTNYCKTICEGGSSCNGVKYLENCGIEMVRDNIDVSNLLNDEIPDYYLNGDTDQYGKKGLIEKYIFSKDGGSMNYNEEVDIGGNTYENKYYGNTDNIDGFNAGQNTNRFYGYIMNNFGLNQGTDEDSSSDKRGILVEQDGSTFTHINPLDSFYTSRGITDTDIPYSTTNWTDVLNSANRDISCGGIIEMLYSLKYINNDAIDHTISTIQKYTYIQDEICIYNEIDISGILTLPITNELLSVLSSQCNMCQDNKEWINDYSLEDPAVVPNYPGVCVPDINVQDIDNRINELKEGTINVDVGTCTGGWTEKDIVNKGAEITGSFIMNSDHTLCDTDDFVKTDEDFSTSGYGTCTRGGETFNAYLHLIDTSTSTPSHHLPFYELYSGTEDTDRDNNCMYRDTQANLSIEALCDPRNSSSLQYKEIMQYCETNNDLQNSTCSSVEIENVSGTSDHRLKINIDCVSGQTYSGSSCEPYDSCSNYLQPLVLSGQNADLDVYYQSKPNNGQFIIDPAFNSSTTILDICYTGTSCEPDSAPDPPLEATRNMDITSSDFGTCSCNSYLYHYNYDSNDITTINCQPNFCYNDDILSHELLYTNQEADNCHGDPSAGASCECVNMNGDIETVRVLDDCTEHGGTNINCNVNSCNFYGNSLVPITVVDPSENRLYYEIRNDSDLQLKCLTGYYTLNNGTDTHYGYNDVIPTDTGTGTLYADFKNSLRCYNDGGPFTLEDNTPVCSTCYNIQNNCDYSDSLHLNVDNQKCVIEQNLAYRYCEYLSDGVKNEYDKFTHFLRDGVVVPCADKLADDTGEFIYPRLSDSDYSGFIALCEFNDISLPPNWKNEATDDNIIISSIVQCDNNIGYYLESGTGKCIVAPMDNQTGCNIHADSIACTVTGDKICVTPQNGYSVVAGEAVLNQCTNDSDQFAHDITTNFYNCNQGTYPSRLCDNNIIRICSRNDEYKYICDGDIDYPPGDLSTITCNVSDECSSGNRRVPGTITVGVEYGSNYFGNECSDDVECVNQESSEYVNSTCDNHERCCEGCQNTAEGSGYGYTCGACDINNYEQTYGYCEVRKCNYNDTLDPHSDYHITNTNGTYTNIIGNTPYYNINNSYDVTCRLGSGLTDSNSITFSCPVDGGYFDISGCQECTGGKYSHKYYLDIGGIFNTTTILNGTKENIDSIEICELECEENTSCTSYSYNGNIDVCKLYGISPSTSVSDPITDDEHGWVSRLGTSNYKCGSCYIVDTTRSNEIIKYNSDTSTSCNNTDGKPKLSLYGTPDSPLDYSVYCPVDTTLRLNSDGTGTVTNKCISSTDIEEGMQFTNIIDPVPGHICRNFITRNTGENENSYFCDSIDCANGYFFDGEECLFCGVAYPSHMHSATSETYDSNFQCTSTTGGIYKGSTGNFCTGYDNVDNGEYVYYNQRRHEEAFCNIYDTKVECDNNTRCSFYQKGSGAASCHANNEYGYETCCREVQYSHESSGYFCENNIKEKDNPLELHKNECSFVKRENYTSISDDILSSICSNVGADDQLSELCQWVGGACVPTTENTSNLKCMDGFILNYGVIEEDEDMGNGYEKTTATYLSPSETEDNNLYHYPFCCVNTSLVEDSDTRYEWPEFGEECKHGYNFCGIRPWTNTDNVKENTSPVNVDTKITCSILGSSMYRALDSDILSILRNIEDIDNDENINSLRDITDIEKITDIKYHFMNQDDVYVPSIMYNDDPDSSDDIFCNEDYYDLFHYNNNDAYSDVRETEFSIVARERGDDVKSVRINDRDIIPIHDYCIRAYCTKPNTVNYVYNDVNEVDYIYRDRLYDDDITSKINCNTLIRNTSIGGRYLISLLKTNNDPFVKVYIYIDADDGNPKIQKPNEQNNPNGIWYKIPVDENVDVRRKYSVVVPIILVSDDDISDISSYYDDDGINDSFYSEVEYVEGAIAICNVPKNDYIYDGCEAFDKTCENWIEDDPDNVTITSDNDAYCKNGTLIDKTRRILNYDNINLETKEEICCNDQTCASYNCPPSYKKVTENNNLLIYNDSGIPIPLEKCCVKKTCNDWFSNNNICPSGNESMQCTFNDQESDLKPDCNDITGDSINECCFETCDLWNKRLIKDKINQRFPNIASMYLNENILTEDLLKKNTTTEQIIQEINTHGNFTDNSTPEILTSCSVDKNVFLDKKGNSDSECCINKNNTCSSKKWKCPENSYEDIRNLGELCEKSETDDSDCPDITENVEKCCKDFQQCKDMICPNGYSQNREKLSNYCEGAICNVGDDMECCVEKEKCSDLNCGFGKTSNNYNKNKYCKGEKCSIKNDENMCCNKNETCSDMDCPLGYFNKKINNNKTCFKGKCDSKNKLDMLKCCVKCAPIDNASLYECDSLEGSYAVECNEGYIIEGTKCVKPNDIIDISIKLDGDYDLFMDENTDPDTIIKNAICTLLSDKLNYEQCINMIKIKGYEKGSLVINFEIENSDILKISEEETRNIFTINQSFEDLNMKIKEEPTIISKIDENKYYQDSKLYCYSDIYKHVCPFGTMLKSNASSINASTSQECCELDWEILKVVLPLFVLMLFALWFIKKRTIG
jgi:hypothetical protein